MLLEVDPRHPSPRQIGKVVEALGRGGLVVYPTDTCYGIGADIFDKKAIERIYRLKGLPKTRPFSFICADLTDISRYAHVTDYAYRILRRLLPGPYTLVLEGSRQVPKMMLTKRRTVGIRIPDHPVCLSIVHALGHPLISTSASIGEGPIWADPREIVATVGKQVDTVIDCGLIYPEPSSVISLVHDQPEVLRSGKGDISLFIGTGG
jgi:tRNA threonylcarbamoyl adenosine modification protein (Sua5/YciO/YrdC/YwlC family)